MMMWHKQCGGPVLYDSLYDNESFIDLSCLPCGKRWHLPKKNPLAQFVLGRANG